MKIRLVPLLVLTILFKLGTAQSEGDKSATDQELEKILLAFKAEFAPDSRTVYFQYHLTDSGRYVVETSAGNAVSYFSSKKMEDGRDLALDVYILPDSDLHGKEYGLINLSVANLRTKPSHSAEMATQALLGTPVDILKERGGFYLIRTPDSYLSWVDRYGVFQMSKDQMDQWQKSKRLIYVVDQGYIYEEADDKAVRVSDLVLGDIVRAGQKVGDFQEVILPDGRRAYARQRDFEDFEDWKKRLEPSADNIIETAKSMIGVPYLWGGTSIKGVDCSGFTKTAFYMNGLVLPRDASQQITKGVSLDVMRNGDLDVGKAKKELRKGDLLFFSASKATNPRLPITHVAIYIDNGEFIHAAGRVRINSFDPSASNYDAQSETIVGAHRYLGVDEESAVPLISSLNVY